jgi:hypothetical protein
MGKNKEKNSSNDISVINPKSISRKARKQAKKNIVLTKEQLIRELEKKNCIYVTKKEELTKLNLSEDKEVLIIPFDHLCGNKSFARIDDLKKEHHLNFLYEVLTYKEINKILERRKYNDNHKI